MHLIPVKEIGKARTTILGSLSETGWHNSMCFNVEEMKIENRNITDNTKEEWEESVQ